MRAVLKAVLRICSENLAVGSAQKPRSYLEQSRGEAGLCKTHGKCGGAGRSLQRVAGGRAAGSVGQPPSHGSQPVRQPSGSTQAPSRLQAGSVQPCGAHARLTTPLHDCHLCCVVSQEKWAAGRFAVNKSVAGARRSQAVPPECCKQYRCTWSWNRAPQRPYSPNSAPQAWNQTLLGW